MADLTVRESKSFWKRPEGKTGGLILAGGAAALFYGWGKIVPFVLDTLHDTFMTSLYVVGLVILGVVAFSPKTHMVFRLVSRAITGMFVEIDPIGIVKDRVSEMKKRREKMDEQVANVSSQLRVLRDTIQRNSEEVLRQQRESLLAQTKSTTSPDKDEQLRMKVASGVKANQAARLARSNITFEQLRGTLQNVYDILIRLQVYLDGYIQDSENEVRTEEIRHKTVNAAVGAWRNAVRIISGNAKEEEVYNQAMEFLADDASHKLGEIEDYQRRVQQFMDNIDIENASVGTGAMKELESFEPKFLPPAAVSPSASVIEMKPTDKYHKLFK